MRVSIASGSLRVTMTSGFFACMAVVLERFWRY
jgi:hypothetical protein